MEQKYQGKPPLVISVGSQANYSCIRCKVILTQFCYRYRSQI